MWALVGGAWRLCSAGSGLCQGYSSEVAAFLGDWWTPGHCDIDSATFAGGPWGWGPATWSPRCGPAEGAGVQLSQLASDRAVARSGETPSLDLLPFAAWGRSGAGPPVEHGACGAERWGGCVVGRWLFTLPCALGGTALRRQPGCVQAQVPEGLVQNPNYQTHTAPAPLAGGTAFASDNSGSDSVKGAWDFGGKACGSGFCTALPKSRFGTALGLILRGRWFGRGSSRAGRWRLAGAAGARSWGGVGKAGRVAGGIGGVGPQTRAAARFQGGGTQRRAAPGFHRGVLAPSRVHASDRHRVHSASGLVAAPDFMAAAGFRPKSDACPTQ